MYEIKVITSLSPIFSFPSLENQVRSLVYILSYSFLGLHKYISNMGYFGGGCFQTKMVCYLHCCTSCFLVSKIRYQHLLSQYIKIHLTLFNSYKIFHKMNDSIRYHRLTSPNSWALTMHPGTYTLGFSDDSVVKNPPANAGEAGLIPESGRSPGEGNGNPLQYSCLENSMDKGA